MLYIPSMQAETTKGASMNASYTLDEEGYRQADHAIFKCANCGYETADLYTAGVINDLSGECPECEHDAARVEEFPETGFGIWCNDNCGWYEADAVDDDLRP